MISRVRAWCATMTGWCTADCGFTPSKSASASFDDLTRIARRSRALASRVSVVWSPRKRENIKAWKSGESVEIVDEPEREPESG